MAYSPGQKVKPKRLRTITLPKILLLVGAAVLVYFGFVFVPPYYRYWKATSILKDEAAKAYSKRNQKDGWTEIEWQIHRRVRDRLLKVLKVEPGGLTVQVEKRRKDIMIKAAWTAYAVYPFIGKRTRMRFTEEVIADLVRAANLPADLV